ncbi:MAG TPA: hypothetical protein VF823_07240 [Anaerolineales bacterium]
MENDPLLLSLSQPPLFELGEPSAETLELFPAVWAAAELLVSPEAPRRRSGLERLAELKAARVSPLVAYLLATRLLDPELELRGRVVRLLDTVLSADDQGRLAHPAVRQALTGWLVTMRTRPIYALLQVAESDPSLDGPVTNLLNACPFAGSQLASLLAERKTPLSIRRQAARFIAMVGYLEAVPTLERLETRLASRQEGQQAMPFLPPDPTDEVALLPAVQAALNSLRAP